MICLLDFAFKILVSSSPPPSSIIAFFLAAYVMNETFLLGRKQFSAFETLAVLQFSFTHIPVGQNHLGIAVLVSTHLPLRTFHFSIDASMKRHITYIELCESAATLVANVF